jgi:hypothetical protein
LIKCLDILKSLSAGPFEIKDKIIKTGCIRKILDYMKVKKKEIYLPCIYIIGNLASDKDVSITERLTDENILSVLLDLFDNQMGSKVIYDLIWVLTNLSDSNLKVVSNIINFDKFHTAMLYILENFNDNQVLIINIVKIQNMFNISFTH